MLVVIVGKHDLFNRSNGAIHFPLGASEDILLLVFGLKEMNRLHLQSRSTETNQQRQHRLQRGFPPGHQSESTCEFSPAAPKGNHTGNSLISFMPHPAAACSRRDPQVLILLAAQFAPLGDVAALARNSAGRQAARPVACAGGERGEGERGGVGQGSPTKEPPRAPPAAALRRRRVLAGPGLRPPGLHPPHPSADSRGARLEASINTVAGALMGRLFLHEPAPPERESRRGEEERRERMGRGRRRGGEAMGRWGAGETSREGPPPCRPVPVERSSGETRFGPPSGHGCGGESLATPNHFKREARSCKGFRLRG